MKELLQSMGGVLSDWANRWEAAAHRDQIFEIVNTAEGEDAVLEEVDAFLEQHGLQDNPYLAQK